MIDADSSTCPMYQECKSANELRWALVEQRHEQQVALNKRMGEFKDRTLAEMSKCKLAIAKSADNTAQLRHFIVAIQKQNKEWMDASNRVLTELSTNMVDLRTSLERRHEVLLERVEVNSGRSDRAVDHAESAAKTAVEANEAAVKAASNLSTMTRATLTLVVVAGTTVSALIVTLVSQYGWPWLIGLFHNLGNLP